jgi:argininosuccinate lyase
MSTKKKNKPKAVRMSPQVKSFLASLPEDEQKVLLDAIGKIATGEVQGELVDESTLSPEEKARIEAGLKSFRMEPDEEPS